MTESKEEPRKLPEFIIIDDESKTETPPHGFPKFKEPIVKQPSWKMRILFIFISLVAFIWTIGALFFTLCSGALTLITFNSVKFFQNLTKLYWSWTRGGTIVTLGFLVSAFNFSLGLIMMIYYFSNAQDNWQKDVVERMMTPHMRDYM